MSCAADAWGATTASAVLPEAWDSLPVDLELEPPPRVREGQVVDRFRIGSVLGVGGHGVVYAAEHVELGYRVALKILDQGAARDARRRARFRREALVGARVRHRHLVGILESGALPDDTPYLVMEHVDGVDLGAMLERQGPLDIAAAIDVGIALLAASAALSAQGLVHRDIKPENVMLSRAIDGAIEIKLLDLGIVKAPRAPKGITLDGYVLGTPHYMSPEQIRGHALDVRSDLYAIGALLYQAIGGALPIDASDTEGVLTKMLIEEPLPLEVRRPDCPPALAAVVKRALAKDREARFRTPGAMAAALASIADELALPRGAAAWRRVAHVLGGPPPVPENAGRSRTDLGSWQVAQRALPTPAERPSALRARRKRPRLCPPWWPAAVALLLAAILGGWAASSVASEDAAPTKTAIAR